MGARVYVRVGEYACARADTCMCVHKPVRCSVCTLACCKCECALVSVCACSCLQLRACTRVSCVVYASVPAGLCVFVLVGVCVCAGVCVCVRIYLRV